MNGLGTGRSSHGSGQLWGRPWWSPQCPCAGEILSGRGQAPPLRSSAVPRFSHIQAGAAGALQRKPPPPESRRQHSPGEVPRRGNRNSPFLAVSRGGLLRRGKSAPQRKANVPVARLQRRPQWLCRGEGTITGARRRHDKKTGVKKGNMEGASAWNKVGRCGQKVNCPEGARESALGRRPLR